MKNKNLKYGEILNKAEQFEKLQEGLSKLIKQSNINKTQLAIKVDMSISYFYSKLNAKDFNAEQLIKVCTAIVETQNYNCAQIYRALFNMQNLNTIKKT